MLLSILYCQPDRIAAAAMACDQLAVGDQYWRDVFPGQIDTGTIFETAQVEIDSADLVNRLLMVGIDQTVDGHDLAIEIEMLGLQTHPIPTKNAA